MIALSPTLFIALGIVVWRLNGTSFLSVSDGSDSDPYAYGMRLQRVIQVGVTLYPILFAAITGRALKMVSQYKTEQGSTIGVRLSLFFVTPVKPYTYSSRLLSDLTYRIAIGARTAYG